MRAPEKEFSSGCIITGQCLLFLQHSSLLLSPGGEYLSAGGRRGHSERAIIWNSTLGHGRNLSLKKYLAVDLRVPLLPRMHNEGINQVSIHYPQS